MSEEKTENLHFKIDKIDNFLLEKIKRKIDLKTKPVGSLGVLERLAEKVALIQNTLTPSLKKPHILIFAGDHGIAVEGVSKYPSEVTRQMVINFLNGGAAINVFCRRNEIEFKVIDAGVDCEFDGHLHLIDSKIARGTRNFLKEPAMTLEQCNEAVRRGAEIVKKINDCGCNVIGMGEMGIGNTSSASAIIHLISGIDLEFLVGRGTGLNDARIGHKLSVIKKAVSFHKSLNSPMEQLAVFGGFEIAQMCGAMLAAAERKMVLLIDGFIASAALLASSCIERNVLEYCVFCHKSAEAGHEKLMSFLGVKPLLELEMRLGEGTGAAIAYPLLRAAVDFLNEMASFESAGVSGELI